MGTLEQNVFIGRFSSGHVFHRLPYRLLQSLVAADGPEEVHCFVVGHSEQKGFKVLDFSDGLPSVPKFQEDIQHELLRNLF